MMRGSPGSSDRCCRAGPADRAGSAGRVDRPVETLAPGTQHRRGKRARGCRGGGAGLRLVGVRPCWFGSGPRRRRRRLAAIWRRSATPTVIDGSPAAVRAVGRTQRGPLVRGPPGFGRRERHGLTSRSPRGSGPGSTWPRPSKARKQRDWLRCAGSPRLTRPRPGEMPHPRSGGAGSVGTSPTTSHGAGAPAACGPHADGPARALPVGSVGPRGLTRSGGDSRRGTLAGDGRRPVDADFVVLLYR